MSTKSAALKTLRTSKHGRVPRSGAVRITEHSGLRKLMRAARRGKVPTERKRVMVEAMQSALRRLPLYMHSHARSADMGAQQ